MTSFTPPPTPLDLAWLALIPTTAPALTTPERGRVTRIRAGALAYLASDVDGPTGPRVVARCDLLLAT